MLPLSAADVADDMRCPAAARRLQDAGGFAASRVELRFTSLHHAEDGVMCYYALRLTDH
jgi:hypothetical protein